MALTLTAVQTMLSNWEAAYNAVSKGSSYSMNGRTLTRADADVCWNQIVRLQRQENQLRRQAAVGSPSVAHSLSNFEEEN